MSTKPDNLMPLQAVITRTGYSRPSIYRLIGLGEFPPQVSLSRRKAVWRESDINAWIKNKTRHVQKWVAPVEHDEIEDLLA